ncbi:MULTISPECIES: FtsB family cell division protein [unclassified Proteiniphilum]|uniref:FtsB family cell division protein n=2 Tax=Dysgonomonadaceae TaxID=2005520 RepID=UPI00257B7A0E|nr:MULTISPECIES: septum formation initiator family protein [unclassified Proteiniphilum]
MKKTGYICEDNKPHCVDYMKVKITEFGSKRILGITSYQIIFLLILIVMLFFFSDSSITKRIKYETQIKDLESQIDFYRQQADADKEKLNELKSNRDDLEKFARENYLMKKENEEIFIIE